MSGKYQQCLLCTDQLSAKLAEPRTFGAGTPRQAVARLVGVSWCWKCRISLRSQERNGGRNELESYYSAFVSDYLSIIRCGPLLPGLEPR
jgi:hypothetical protein